MNRWKWATVFYLCVLTIFSLKPGSSTSEECTVWQVVHNAMHFPAYMVLAFLIMQCFGQVNRISLVSAIGLSFVFGVLMEMGQTFVPHRHASLSDIVVNTAGAVLMILLIKVRWIKIGSS